MGWSLKKLKRLLVGEKPKKKKTTTNRKPTGTQRHRGGGSKPSNSRGNERRQGSQRAREQGKQTVQRATNAARSNNRTQTGTQQHRSGATTRSSSSNRSQVGSRSGAISTQRRSAANAVGKSVSGSIRSLENSTSGAIQSAKQKAEKNRENDLSVIRAQSENQKAKKAAEEKKKQDKYKAFASNAHHGAKEVSTKSKQQERREGIERARRAQEVAGDIFQYAAKDIVATGAQFVANAGKNSPDKVDYSKSGDSLAAAAKAKKTGEYKPTKKKPKDSKINPRTGQYETTRDMGKKAHSIADKLSASAEKEIEDATKHISDKKSFNMPRLGSEKINDLIGMPSTKSQKAAADKQVKKQFKTEYEKGKAEVITEVGKQLDKEAAKYGISDDTVLTNGMTYAEFRKSELKKAIRKYYGQMTSLQEEALAKNADVGKVSKKDLAQLGIKGGVGMAELLVPYIGTAGKSLKAADVLASSSKALTAAKGGGRVLTKAGENAVKGAAKKAAKGGVQAAADDIAKQVAKSDLKSNVKREILANALQDASIGTTIDYATTQKEGLSGKEAWKYMGKSALMNAALGAPIAGVAGRTGKASKNALKGQIRDTFNAEFTKMSKMSKEQAGELIGLLKKEEAGILTKAESDRLTELSNSVYSNRGGVVQIDKKGRLVVNDGESAKSVLSPKEQKDYIQLQTQYSAGVLPKDKAKRLRELDAKVKTAYEVAYRNADTTLRYAKKGAEVDRDMLESMVQTFKRTGDNAKLKQAEKILDADIKASIRRNESMAKAVETISEKTGTKYRLVADEQMREIAGKDLAEDEFAKGYFHEDKDGNIEILINRDSPQAHQTVIGHETGHLIKTSSEEEFKKLGDMLRQYSKDKGELDAFEAEMRRNYPELSEEGLNEEITCELLGRYIFGEDDTFLRRLAGEQPSTFQKIVDYVKGLALKITDPEMAQRLKAMSDKAEGLIEDVGHKANVDHYSPKKYNNIKEGDGDGGRHRDESVSGNSAPEGGSFNAQEAKEIIDNTDPQHLEEHGPEAKFSKVTKKETLDFLDKQEKEGKVVETYRAMAMIDGKLYPPMATKIKSAEKGSKAELQNPNELGVWEQADEHPELIKDFDEEKGYGKFILRKDNGDTVPAAYNPYIHSSFSPLNDQFTSAYKRPNLVVVKGIVPASEATSGYKAQYAKDAVGKTQWHSGVVAGQLPEAREVMLSRWFKPTEVMDDADVAAVIKDTLDGTGIEIPYNVVTPSLRRALEDVGVPIGEGQGIRNLPPKDSVKYSKSKMTKAQEKAMTKRDADEHLTKAEFSRLYSAHKLDLRKSGDVDKQIESIMKDGFKGDAGFGVNVMPVSTNDSVRSLSLDDIRKQRDTIWKETRGRAMTDAEFNKYVDELKADPPRGSKWIGDRFYPSLNMAEFEYGARKGDKVLLVPEAYVEDGSKVKNGFKPKDYEVVTVERDFQPYYELYEKAQNGGSVKLSKTKDSAGTKLSDGQQRHFAESKATDTDGNLLRLYHGTPSAGFTKFNDERGVWLTTSQKDADAYGGNWEHKEFDPNEKTTREPAVGGDYTLADTNPYLEGYRFDTEADRAKFIEDHPGIEKVRDADTLDDMEYEGEITSKEASELTKLEKQIRSDYHKYELKHSDVATWQDILDRPDDFSKGDIENAILARDKEAEIDPDMSREEVLENFKFLVDDDKANLSKEEFDSLMGLEFKTRIPAGKKGTYVNYPNQRTYPLYANVKNPIEVDAKGRHMSDGFYDYIDEARNGDYDGAIIRNVKVGRSGEAGDVVWVKSGNQVKDVRNQNPTESRDIRFSKSKRQKKKDAKKASGFNAEKAADTETLNTAKSAKKAAETKLAALEGEKKAAAEESAKLDTRRRNVARFGKQEGKAAKLEDIKVSKAVNASKLTQIEKDIEATTKQLQDAQSIIDDYVKNESLRVPKGRQEKKAAKVGDLKTEITDLNNQIKDVKKNFAAKRRELDALDKADISKMTKAEADTHLAKRNEITRELNEINDIQKQIEKRQKEIGDIESSGLIKAQREALENPAKAKNPRKTGESAWAKQAGTDKESIKRRERREAIDRGIDVDAYEEAKVSYKNPENMSSTDIDKELNRIYWANKNAKTESHTVIRNERKAQLESELQRRKEDRPAYASLKEDQIPDDDPVWSIKDDEAVARNESAPTEPAKVHVNKANKLPPVMQTTSRRKSFNQSWRRLLVNSLTGFEDFAKANKNDKLLSQINNVQHWTNKFAAWIEGERSGMDRKVSGKGLNDIFKSHDLFGKENMARRNDLTNYIIYKHAIDRLKYDKPVHADPDVGGSMYSTADYERMIKEIEDKYRKPGETGTPKALADFEKDIHGYFDDLLQMRVDSGLISKEFAEDLRAKYPNYIPTLREGDDWLVNGVETGGKQKFGIDESIKAATGGNGEIMDLYQAAMRITRDVVRDAEQNELLRQYASALGRELTNVPEGQLGELPSFAAHASRTRDGWRISFFHDGQMVTMPVDKQIAKGMREINGEDWRRLLAFSSKLSPFMKGFKGLITDYNVIFGVRNGMRDIQQAAVNSKSLKEFTANIPTAQASVLRKYTPGFEADPWMKSYEANGGMYTSFVQQDRKYVEPGTRKVGGALAKPLQALENVNSAIEATPRMAEYIGTIKKDVDAQLRKEGSSLKKFKEDLKKEYYQDGRELSEEQLEKFEDEFARRVLDMASTDTIEKAARNAADITLNFSRNGVIGKALNMGIVPYFNPSVQGLSKTVRMFTENGAAGMKSLLNFGMKLGTLTIAPAVVNEILCAGDRDYQNLNTREKDANFFIPIGDGRFIKVPKPRENAVLAEPATYGLRYFLEKASIGEIEWAPEKLKTGVISEGEYSQWKDLGQLFVSARDNIGPANPFKDNIVSPIIRLAQNKTWYGGSIESTGEVIGKREGDTKNSEIYDETTSAIAKQIGQMKLGNSTVSDITHMSPKKIDDFMDSYLGVIYDLGISQTADVTHGNPFVNQFVKDSVFSNKTGVELWSEFDKANAPKTKKGKAAQAVKDAVLGHSVLNINDKTTEAKDWLNQKGYDDMTYSTAVNTLRNDDSFTDKQKENIIRNWKKKQIEMRHDLVYGSKEVSYRDDPLKTIAKTVGVDKAMRDYTYTYEDPETGEKRNQHLDAWKAYKKSGEYKNNPKASGNKFIDFYAKMRWTNGRIGEGKSYPKWMTASILAATEKGNNDALAKAYIRPTGWEDGESNGKLDPEYQEKIIQRGKNYRDYGFTQKDYRSSQKTIFNSGRKLGYEYMGQMMPWDEAMSLSTAKKNYADGAYYSSDTSGKVSRRMNYARCLNKKGYSTKQINKFAKDYDLDVPTTGWNGDQWRAYDAKVEAAVKKKYGDRPLEEQAAIYHIITDDTYHHPFGEVGDYSQKNDTGITDLDKRESGGWGRRGWRRRRHGWGHGWGRGGSGGGTGIKQPETASGAINGKITDPFVGRHGKPSNVDDAYRKRARKLMQATRKKLS